jgi:DNA processing protein
VSEPAGAVLPGLTSDEARRRSDEQRLARGALSYLAEPGDQALGALLEAYEPAEVLAAIKVGRLPADVDSRLDGINAIAARRAVLARALGRWRLRLPRLPGDLADVCGDEIRLVYPSDPEWPGQLDQLAAARPYVLWVRGRGDLRSGLSSSVSIVGSRAATGYGAHVAGEIAGDLAERGWTIVSGGAYGIDAAAHRGALNARGTTIAVLACGVDFAYPAGHADLFAAIVGDGLLVSEWPPGSRPTRLRFLIRNRVIATLSGGTVIVEAGRRSGALSTARHAAELNRPLMAVPGPVTSDQSAGCHQIIREWGATLVTCAAHVMDMLGPLGVCAAEPGAIPRGRDDQDPDRDDQDPDRDELDLDSARVLDAFPARSGVGPATIARTAGVEFDAVLGCLGVLAATGFIETCEQGWRLTAKARKCR